MGERLYRVGQVALLFGVHPNTVRAWATKGLIEHGRTPGKDGHRLFTLENINQTRGKLGLPAIDEIGAQAILVQHRPKRRRRVL